VATKDLGSDDDLTDHERDDQLAQVILKQSRAEARVWLRQGGHMMVRGENDDAARLVETFYQAGAEKVDVSDIQKAKDGMAYAQVLVITLPKKDPKARAAVIQVAADHNFSGVKKPARTMKEFGFFDSGQQYLMVNFL
jgi:hypothetical protein